MKTKIFISLSCCALFLGYYAYLNVQPPQKASRAIASVEKGFDFLSSKELQLLTPQEQRDYLSKISQTIVKAGVFKGVFRDRRKRKVSSNSFDFSLGVPKAFAAYHCPMYGLHPFLRANRSECSMLPKAIKISGDSENFFASDSVEAAADREDSQSIAKCPSGQKMCNPALIGFDFDENGKARLRCADNASNANCYALRTNGEQMRKSLELLNKANPRYWDEFAKGMEEQCIVDGKFNEEDEGCEFARKQMNYSTNSYRNKLNQRYKDLAAKLIEAEAATSSAAEATTSCFDIKKAAESEGPDAISIGSLRDVGNIGGQSFTGDGAKFIEYAALACDKSVADMVNQYGVCDKKIPDERKSLEDEQDKDKDLLEKAEEVIELIDKLPDAIKTQINSQTSMLKIRTLLSGNDKTVDSNTAYRAWVAFVNHSSNEDKRNPLAVVANYKTKYNDLFKKALNKRLAGGRFTESERKFHSDFKHNFGMEMEEMKGLFCPSPAKNSFEFSEISRKSSNWEKFTAKCLGEMGFGRQSNSLTVTRPNPSQGGANSFKRSCEWKEQDADKILEYFNGTESSFNEALYIKKRNALTNKLTCVKIEKCNYSRWGSQRTTPITRRGLLIDGRCLSNSHAIDRISADKSNISKLKCEDEFTSSRSRRESEADTLLRERSVN